MAISQGAFDLIVACETAGEQAHAEKHARPFWPGNTNGVTIGLGYDLGYRSVQRFREDWGRVLSAETCAALEPACGVTGAAAAPFAERLAGVSVSWEQALQVFRDRVIPHWVGIVQGALPHTRELSHDCLGALVSLVFNRGPSFSKTGDRYIEMRAIHQHMANREFARIPGEIRAMKRLWPEIPGLRVRRDREADLFERGLSPGQQASTAAAGAYG